ncbi:MAG: hypothetical protein IKB08_06405 [Clostridia bacterium]|nr:hypothetical protein [Clostridia bacterium]
MAVCTFFGHRECPENIMPDVKRTIINLYANNNVTKFYVGNNGNFDSIVLRALKDIRKDHPELVFSVVLAYYPKENIADSIYPEGLETVPKKFCIDKRNLWMLNESDYVITYIRRNTGGAAKYAEKAKKKNKTVINL